MEAKDKSRNEKLQKEIEAIFAKPKEVAVGEMTFKVVTVSMGELPEIEKLLQKYNEIMVNNKYQVSKASTILVAEIIQVGIAKHHPDWTVEIIAENVPYEYFPDFIKAITGNENFIKKMQEMGGTTNYPLSD